VRAQIPPRDLEPLEEIVANLQRGLGDLADGTDEPHTLARLMHTQAETMVDLTARLVRVLSN
jgi:hypothetical protein